MKHIYHVVNTTNEAISATEVFDYGEKGYIVVKITPRGDKVPVYLMEKFVEPEDKIFSGLATQINAKKEIILNG